jgi:type VI secretion system protein ImpH
MAAADWESDAGVDGGGPADSANDAAAPTASVTAAQTNVPGQFDDLPLAELLWTEPFRFEFFAALRVLARIGEEHGAKGDDPLSPLERIRFRAHQSLSFPASEIWDITRPAGERLAEMTVAFLGLTGPMGALPRPYTEHMLQRVRKGDHAFRDFLDLFNHRLTHLFAQAAAKYRFYYTFETASARERLRQRQGSEKLRGFLLGERPGIDLFSQVLLDVGGLGTPLLRYKDSVRTEPDPRLDIPDTVLRYFSGHLAQQHRTAVSLGHVLSELFGVSAAILPLIGQWLQLPAEYQTCLKRRDLGAFAASGRPKSSSGSDPRLGHNTVVGSRVWEVQGRFRVRLGPLKFEQFQHFLPVGRKYRQLAHLVRLYVGATFDFDVQPVLEGEEVPWCRFGAKGPHAPRLGWNTWLRNRPFRRDVDDAVFRVPDQVSMSS